MTVRHTPVGDASSGPAYEGKAGVTRTEALHMRQAGGALRSVQVYRVVNVATHPELRDRVQDDQLNRLDDGSEVAVPFVYHDPSALRFALVLPPSLAHLELKERAQLMTELAADSEHMVPAYVREGVTVLGLAELERYLDGLPPQDETFEHEHAPSRVRVAREVAIVPLPARPVRTDANRAPRSGILAGIAQLLQVKRNERDSAPAAVAARRLSRGSTPPPPRPQRPALVAAASSLAKPQGAPQRDAKSSPGVTATVSEAAQVGAAPVAKVTVPPITVPPAIGKRPAAGPRPALSLAALRKRAAAATPASPVPRYTSPAAPSTPASGTPSLGAVSQALGAAIDERPLPVQAVAVEPPAQLPAVSAGSAQPVALAPVAEGFVAPSAMQATTEPTAVLAATPRPDPSSDLQPEQAAATLVADHGAEPVPSLQQQLEALPVLGMALRCEGDALNLYVKLDDKRAAAYDDEADLLVQLAQVQGRPLVVLALLGDGRAVARTVLDGLAPTTQALLERLGRDFRVQLKVCVDDELDEAAARPIFAPRESNARAILARLLERAWQPELGAQEAIAACLAAPPKVRDPQSPFAPARLPPPSTSSTVADLARLEHFVQPERVDDALLLYSIPKPIIDAWYRRVLRGALSFGIAVPEALTGLLVQQQLAADRATFVRDQLKAFRNRVERGQNDLDPRETQRNWDTLAAQAAALGVGVEGALPTATPTPAAHAPSP